MLNDCWHWEYEHDDFGEPTFFIVSASNKTSNCVSKKGRIWEVDFWEFDDLKEALLMAEKQQRFVWGIDPTTIIDRSEVEQWINYWEQIKNGKRPKRPDAPQRTKKT